jgi:hypothetical protein
MFPGLENERGPTTSKPTRDTGTASTASSPISTPTIRRSGRRHVRLPRSRSGSGHGVPDLDELLSQAGDVLTGPHGEAREKCRNDIDVSVWRCALVPAATTDKERVPVNSGMLWSFFATGAAIWIALWAAIRLERRLGLTSAPTRNAPAARPTGRHHRCRNMPPARRPGLCHGPHISCPPVRACPPGRAQSSRGPVGQARRTGPATGSSGPSRGTGPAPPPTSGSVIQTARS